MAGVSTKEIKNRIRSMESTKQITKAMEMVAASKLRHAQSRLQNSRPYFEILSNTISDIVHSGTDCESPYFTRQPGGKSLYIIIAGDRGLAGGYNSNVLKLAEAEMADKDCTVLPIGKKAMDYYRARKAPIFTAGFAEAADVSMGDCFSVAKQLCKAFLSGEFCEIFLIYTNFISVLSQIPTVIPLLPLQPQADAPASAREILYEPNAAEVFDRIVPEYLGGVIYGTLCESLASEQAARRTAMDSATQNAEDMIADLSLKFNQARQAAITQQITEIVAGS